MLHCPKYHPKLVRLLFWVLFSSHKQVGWWIGYSKFPVNMCMVLWNVVATHLVCILACSQYSWYRLCPITALLLISSSALSLKSAWKLRVVTSSSLWSALPVLSPYLSGEISQHLVQTYAFFNDYIMSKNHFVYRNICIFCPALIFLTSSPCV